MAGRSKMKIDTTFTPFSHPPPVKKKYGGKKRLLSLTGERMLHILDETIKDIELALRIPELCRKKPKMEDAFDDCLLKLYCISCLDLGYETEDTDTLVSIQRSSISIAGHPTMFSAATLKHAGQSVKDFIRKLSECPHANNAVFKKTTLSVPARNLVVCLKELRDFFQEQLLTSDFDEKLRNDLLDEYQRRDKRCTDEIERLRVEVEAANTELHEEFEDVHEILDQLEDDLEKMLTVSAEYILRIRVDSERQLILEEKNSRHRQNQLNEDFNQIWTNFGKRIKAHREAESILRKKKFKMNAEVENWIVKYDGDMIERQAIYDALMEDYIKEKAELMKKMDELKDLEEEYTAIMKEREEAEADRRFKEDKAERQYKAAVRIQSLWRGYRIRKMLRKLKKKSRRVSKNPSQTALK